MLFNISHKTSGVYQALLVEAPTQEIAEVYFRERKPDSEFVGIHEARSEDFKPGKPVMVVPEGYGLNRVLCRILYEGVNGASQSLVLARTQEIAKAYFESEQPGDVVYSVHPEKMDVVRWGVHMRVVPEDFTIEFLKNRARAFNEKMAELEAQGLRSGGWDEKTDKTAIVKVGKTWNDNRIVGYMDRELNIEWTIKVLSVERADEHYLEGSVFVDGKAYPFDYNVETEAIDIHCYSEAGWMTGASYEKELPEIVTDNMEEIFMAIISAVDDWLEQEGYVKLSGKTVDELLVDAQPRAQEGSKQHSEVDLVK